MSESVRLDPEALARLKEWGGADLVSKMMGLFLENAPQRMDQIREGVAQENAELVERGAHSLKSTGANLGAQRLRELAATLEERAEAGESASLADELKELERVYQLTCDAVNAFLEDDSVEP